jgi:hypothetical protein
VDGVLVAAEQMIMALELFRVVLGLTIGVKFRALAVVVLHGGVLRKVITELGFGSFSQNKISSIEMNIVVMMAGLLYVV